MTSTVPNAVEHTDERQQPPITMFGPDFPYAYDDFLAHPAGLGQVPATEHGTEVTGHLEHRHHRPTASRHDVAHHRAWSH